MTFGQRLPLSPLSSWPALLLMPDRKSSLRLSRLPCERDGVAEALELFDEALGLAFGVALGEVVGAEVAVGLAGGEHVPDRAEQRVLDGAECALVAAACLEPLV